MRQDHTIGSLFQKIKSEIGSSHEARLILEWVSGYSVAEQITDDRSLLSVDEINQIKSIITRRKSGEPFDHIQGFKNFYGLEFKINQSVLSPRPETEMLVDFVLGNSEKTSDKKIIDLGTGSGCIALSILANRPAMMAILVDKSEEALKVAKINARELGLQDRVNFVRSDWWENVTGTFDFVISNPPYIKTDIISDLDAEVRKFDPVLALDGGTTGLDAYKAIISKTARFLNPEGWVILEIGFDQGQSVAEIVAENRFSEVRVFKDLSYNDRMITGRSATDWPNLPHNQ